MTTKKDEVTIHFTDGENNKINELINEEKNYKFSLTPTALSELTYFESETIDEYSPPQKIVLAEALLKSNKKNEFEVPESNLHYLASALESAIDILKDNRNKPAALKSLEKLSMEVVLLNNQINASNQVMSHFEKNKNVSLDKNIGKSTSTNNETSLNLKDELSVGGPILSTDIKKMLNLNDEKKQKNKI